MPRVCGEVGHRVMPGILEVFRAVGKGEPGLEGVLQGRVRECHLLGNWAPRRVTSPTRTARMHTWGAPGTAKGGRSGSAGEGEKGAEFSPFSGRTHSNPHSTPAHVVRPATVAGLTRHPLRQGPDLQRGVTREARCDDKLALCSEIPNLEKPNKARTFSGFSRSGIWDKSSIFAATFDCAIPTHRAATATHICRTFSAPARTVPAAHRDAWPCLSAFGARRPPGSDAGWEVDARRSRALEEDPAGWCV